MLGRKNFFFHQHLFFLAPSPSEPSFITLSIPPFLSPFQFLSLCYPFTHSLSHPPFLFSLSRSFSLSPSLYLPMPFVSPPLTSPHLTSQDVNERAKAESLLSSTAAAQAAGQIRRLSGMKRKPTIKFCQLFTSHIPFCLL